MFLAFRLSDIVTVPFGYLISWLYEITNNYGLALIIFTVIVKLVLLPVSAKSKKSMMKMSRLSPFVNKIKDKYPNDQMKQNQAVQELYKKEGVSMGSGCLWSVVPLLIMFPLYSVVRQPITYMLHESAEIAEQIVNAIRTAAPDLFGKDNFYTQMIAAANLPNFADVVKTAVPTVSQSTLQGINFNFLGIDLGTVPDWLPSRWPVWDWAHIGAFLLPCLSAGIQVVSMLISNKLNNSVASDENGVHDEDAAKTQAQSTRAMMFTMPLMTLWIGFSIPGALSLYWFAQSVVTMIQDAILTQHYRKIYDAEDAVRVARMLEEERIEAEKERLRAERRAANPDGQTQNTSKKKLQKLQQQEEAAAKAAAAKEYAARHGGAVETETTVDCLSGIPERPFCKGRAYDPNRYSKQNTEE